MGDHGLTLFTCGASYTARNKPDPGNAGIASRLTINHSGPGAAEADRSVSPRLL